MSAEQPGNRVPYLPLMASFSAAKARSTADTAAWIADPNAWAKELGEAFAASIEALEAHYASKARRDVSMHGDASAPGTEPAVSSEKTARSRRIANALWSAGGLDVPGDGDRSTSFLGFELSPLRTQNGAELSEVDGVPLPSSGANRKAGNSIRIDLLGLARDGLPVVQELKVDEDSDPPVALVQLLLYAATLAPLEQFLRLRTLYPQLVEQTAPVSLRLQLLVAGRVRPERSERRPLWAAAPGLIAALLKRDEIRRHVRSIDGLRLTEPIAGGPATAEPLRWAD